MATYKITSETSIYNSSNSNSAYEGDVNGDGKADIAIEVLDIRHSISWSVSDFDL